MKRSGVLSDTGLSFCQGRWIRCIERGSNNKTTLVQHGPTNGDLQPLLLQMGTSLIYQPITGVIVLVSSRLANLIFQSICCVLVGVVSQRPQFVHGNPYDSDP